MTFFSILIWNKCNAETNTKTLPLGVVIATSSNAIHNTIMSPAAVHLVSGTLFIIFPNKLWLRFAAVVDIIVQTPLPHISAHIIDAKFVWRFGLYFMSCTA